MCYSNSNYPGGTKTYKASSIRVSEQIAMMQVCNIKVGPQKASLIDVLNGKPKNNPHENIFYLLRELKCEKNQWETRTSTSRTSGIVHSKGIYALPYNWYKTPIILKRKCECEVSVHMISFLRNLFGREKRGEIKNGILFAKDDTSTFKIINTNKGSRIDRWCRQVG